MADEETVIKFLSEKKEDPEQEENNDKTGILYLSRVPPYMPPHQVKYLLSKYGEVGRVYLAPEPDIHSKRRKKYKKDRRVKYVEGWIEFMDKGVAKKVCQHLNGELINVKRRSAYRNDLWNLKYLPKFKWADLTEQLVYEQKVRMQKLRVGISQAKKENEAYIKHVEQTKAIEAIKQRKSKKKDKMEEESMQTSSDLKTQKNTNNFEVRRTFKQRVPKNSVDSTKASESRPSTETSSIIRSLLC